MIDIDQLSEAELIDLNHRIVERSRRESDARDSIQRKNAGRHHG